MISAKFREVVVVVIYSASLKESSGLLEILSNKLRYIDHHKFDSSLEMWLK